MTVYFEVEGVFDFVERIGRKHEEIGNFAAGKGANVVLNAELLCARHRSRADRVASEAPNITLTRCDQLDGGPPRYCSNHLTTLAR